MHFTQSSALLALAAGASAHMSMLTPVPYGLASLNSSPLGEADFPCKQRGGAFDVTEMNQWNAGESQTISFKGSAVHGGGSCQFSLSTDAAPTKDSQWKVIHSVIGGCPSDAEGNLPENAEGRDASKFDVMMPKDIPAGKYSFAWTWLNKVGNREFYMNCAPVEIANSAGDPEALSKLPDMWVSNLNEKSACHTAEGQDFKYPNPGSSVVTGSKAVVGDVLNDPIGDCAAMTAMGAGSGSMGAPQPGGGDSETPKDDTPKDDTPEPETPKETPAPSTPTPAPVYPPVSPPATGGNASGTACTTDGALVCIGSSQFGICDRGYAVAQNLAAGMTCANGAIQRRSVYAPRAHLHRRHNKGL